MLALNCWFYLFWVSIVKVETREAQEANLLNLYTFALKGIAAGNISTAKDNLNEIINNPIFQVNSF